MWTDKHGSSVQDCPVIRESGLYNSMNDDAMVKTSFANETGFSGVLGTKYGMAKYGMEQG